VECIKYIQNKLSISEESLKYCNVLVGIYYDITKINELYDMVYAPLNEKKQLTKIEWMKQLGDNMDNIVRGID